MYFSPTAGASREWWEEVQQQQNDDPSKDKQSLSSTSRSWSFRRCAALDPSCLRVIADASADIVIKQGGAVDLSEMAQASGVVLHPTFTRMSASLWHDSLFFPTAEEFLVKPLEHTIWGDEIKVDEVDPTFRKEHRPTLSSNAYISHLDEIWETASLNNNAANTSTSDNNNSLSLLFDGHLVDLPNLILLCNYVVASSFFSTLPPTNSSKQQQKASLIIEELRFRHCALTRPQLHLLARLLNCGSSTVVTLYLDNNRQRVPPQYHRELHDALAGLSEMRRHNLAVRKLKPLREKLARRCSDLREAFDRVDVNKDKKISWPEFAKSFHSMGFSSYELHLQFALLDTNGDGYLNVDEFAEALDWVDDEVTVVEEKQEILSFQFKDIIPSEWLNSKDENDRLQDYFLDPWSCSLGAILLPSTSTITTSLIQLSLRSCGLRRSTAFALFEALQTNSSLLSLNLCDNELDDGAAADLGISLYFNRSLQCLSLSANPISTDGLLELTKYLGWVVMSGEAVKHLPAAIRDARKKSNLPPAPRTTVNSDAPSAVPASAAGVAEKKKFSKSLAQQQQRLALLRSRLIVGDTVHELLRENHSRLTFLPPPPNWPSDIVENVAKDTAIRWRNTSLKLLSLEFCRVSDSRRVIEQVQPHGTADSCLFLRDTPSAKTAVEDFHPLGDKGWRIIWCQ